MCSKWWQSFIFLHKNCLTFLAFPSQWAAKLKPSRRASFFPPKVSFHVLWAIWRMRTTEGKTKHYLWGSGVKEILTAIRQFVFTSCFRLLEYNTSNINVNSHTCQELSLLINWIRIEGPSPLLCPPLVFVASWTCCWKYFFPGEKKNAVN